MNKRFFLALILTAIVIVATPLLFPSAARKPVTITAGDTVAAAIASQAVTSTTSPSTAPAGVAQPTPAVSPATPTTVAINGASTIVRLPRATYAFNSKGAVATSVVLDSYPSRRPTIGAKRAGSVELIAPRQALSSYHLRLGPDTIALDTVLFQLEPRAENSSAPVVYRANAAGRDVRVSYTFADDAKDAYLVHAAVGVAGAPAGSSVVVDLPRTMFANEPDTLDDISHLAVAYRSARREIKSTAFNKLDSTEVIGDEGPIAWAATRNKYFLVAYRSEQAPFSMIRLQGAPRPGKVATNALASVTAPIKADGTAAFDIYAGPQDFVRLERLGSDLDQVNPYGSFLRAIVQPFAGIIMRTLLWMKHTTHLNYGWVLVLFGVFIRLVLWPLNQGAMRTSMKMQRLQPELQALQKKHGDDPKKQQEAIMKVYAEHGMSPLSPLMGCLPLLLPMPVLFALYHVFQNTIEFRGVSFLWLPDISVRDPLFITPLLMGVTMYLMSWISMRNSPPNPQAKMMAYMMPVMMTVIFLNFASGLNLYYAVQNIAALPQQWLLARERGKPENALPVVSDKKRA